MSDRNEPPVPTSASDSENMQRYNEKPGFVDGIPVEDLVRLTREFTGRITNEDRQRLAAELNESGHQRSIQSSAPYLLQGFYTGKLDLDVELTRRFPAPPLLSNATFAPKPGQHRKHGFAQFSSQDTAASMTIEIHSDALEVGFLLYSMIGVRFTLGEIAEAARNRFLELLARPNGIAFLWTRERWERDYLIFIIRERFTRVYAFGPGRVEAASRLTPDSLEQLRAWLSGFWNPSGDSQPDEARSTFNW
ncbi:MAG: hypothetical protein ACYDBJ_29235 [Aggregatilineales bacterium]